MRGHFSIGPTFLALVTTFACALIADSAYASGGVSCYSSDGKANISVGMGRVPVYSPTNVSAEFGKKHWSGNAQKGDIQLGGTQGMLEEHRLAIDFADENTERIIISLRVDLTAEEGEEGVPGVLTSHGLATIKVDCQFE